MGLVGELQEHLGRAGYYAGAALHGRHRAIPSAARSMQRVDEESTAIATRADLLRARVGRASRRAGRGAARRRPARRSAPTTCARPAATGPTCSPSPRRRSSPRRPSPARARGSRLFSELTSAIAVELDGEAVALEQGLSPLSSPDRSVRRGGGRGGDRGPRARAADAGVRLQHAAGRQVDRRPAALATRRGSRAGTSPTRPATSRCRRSSRRWSPATTSRSAGTRSRRSCSASTGSPTTTAWRAVAESTRSSSAGRGARVGARRVRVVLARAGRRSRQPLLRRVAGSTRRCARASGRARSAPTRCRRTTRTCCSTGPSSRRDVLTLAHELGHGLHAYLSRGQGVFHHEHAADARRDRVGVRRDRHLRPASSTRPDDPGRAARAARREPRGSDRDGVPPDRDEPVRGRACTPHRREVGRAVRRATSASCGPARRPRCSATPSRSPRATARGGPTSRTSSARPATSTPTPTASCWRCRCTAGTRSGAPSSCRRTSSCSRRAGRARPRSSARSSDCDLADPGLLGRWARDRRAAARGGRGGGDRDGSRPAARPVTTSVGRDCSRGAPPSSPAAGAGSAARSPSGSPRRGRGSSSPRSTPGGPGRPPTRSWRRVATPRRSSST